MRARVAQHLPHLLQFLMSVRSQGRALSSSLVLCVTSLALCLLAACWTTTVPFPVSSSGNVCQRADADPLAGLKALLGWSGCSLLITHQVKK